MLASIDWYGSNFQQRQENHLFNTATILPINRLISSNLYLTRFKVFNGISLAFNAMETVDHYVILPN
jgi:hypothetical protein